MLRRVLHTHVMVEEAPFQKQNVFMTKCKVNGDIYDLLMDSGSEANIVSVGLVKKLKLKIIRHPNPYKLSWLDKSKTQVLENNVLFFFLFVPTMVKFCVMSFIWMLVTYFLVEFGKVIENQFMMD